MSNSGSEDEEVSRKHYKKSKHRMPEKHKKRRRSSSENSSYHERLGRKKNISRKEDSDNESTMSKRMSKHKKSRSNKRSSDDVNSSHSKDRYDDDSDSDADERRVSTKKLSKQSEISGNRFSRNKKRKYIDENKISDDSSCYLKIPENDNRKIEARSKYSEKDRRNKSEKNKEDRRRVENKSYGKREGSRNQDEDDRNASSAEKPYRLWSSSRGTVRKNSDSYWNKYSERLKEPAESMEVGPRYYGSGGSPRREKTNDNSKDISKDDTGTIKENPVNEVPKQKKTVDMLTSRTGGAYIPPAKLRMMQESIQDKASPAYQRLAWEALKKSIQGHINKVNTSNMKDIFNALIKENIVRGKGLLCRALIQAQAASPSFTNVYASLVCRLNARFPKIGELLLHRLVIQFRRGFKRNDKTICITAATFIAHLVNQEVTNEILALELLILLTETPTDDSVEVAIAFMKECGMKLTEVCSRGVMIVFDKLRSILHEGNLEKRVQYMIEVMFQIRKEDFKAHPSVIEGLSCDEDVEKITHVVTLEENHDPEDILNVFKVDPDYEANEAKYKAAMFEGDDDESGGEGSSGSGDSDDDSEEEDEEGKGDGGVIVDRTETNLVALRKTIYLTIQSSLDFEECAHKLLRMELKPGQEIEMAHMFLDCCAEQRTYEKFFGLLAQRFCQINRSYIGPFEETFRDSYETIHRMSNDKLRNVAKLFAHLLFTDAISWEVLATIRLNEDDTSSSSRIFIKILFLELSEYMGLAKLNQRVKDPSMQSALDGLFPRDNPKHTRFAINFFTSIGLGGLTDELREHLKNQPKQSLAVPQMVEGLSSSSSSSDSSSESSDSSDSSSESSSSDSSSSDSDDKRSKKKRQSKLASKRKQLGKKVENVKSSKKRRNSPVKSKTNR